MHEMLATSRPLTASWYPADRSIPLIEQPVGEILLAAADRFDDAIALIDGQSAPGLRRSWSFRDLAADARLAAQALLEHFEPGDHVAIWSSNRPEWAIVEYGAALAGLVLVTVNPAYLAHELTHVLRQSRAKGIIVEDNYRGRDLCAIVAQVRTDLPGLEFVLPLSGWGDFMTTDTDRQLPKVLPEAIAQIQYTSGTTGFPKGACLKHRGLANNARLYAETIGAREGDVWINAMPMFHTAGCGLATLGALQTGGTQVMAPGFDADRMLDLFEHLRGTITLCVPTMLTRMLEVQEKAPRDLTTWRLVTLGGAPVPPELVRRAQRVAGVEVGIGFGQTESSPYLTHTLPADPHPQWAETIGRPLPQTEVKIIDPASGAVQPIGVSGEICARGYCIMAGYHDSEEATKSAIDAEGWLHTGDVGSMDEYGYCRVLGRLRDMIIRGGENVYPREIEDVLIAHPGVADAAVVGIPDADWGETVAACIRPAEAGQPSPEDLTDYCRARLAGYKVPRRWHFMEVFPQTASGKVQKFALRDILLSRASGD
ncbi:AMP-binding protein [Sphingopyxis sp. DHUNG17]|uniref:AMP-binding protein n=1 Tax=Sphingopyxis jiangsuensis TaxID=2871171 RepID=UPI00191EE4E6|nr:AMP-binding protein [Sphingopyxis lutea]MBL0770055.1 AMP-binding protein [Sphingopyxis lutea]